VRAAGDRAVGRLPAASGGQDNDMGVMRRLDELFTQWPFQRLMRQMGHRRPGAQAAYEQTGTWPYGLSLPAARLGDRSAQPGVGGRHHLPPDRPGLSVLGGGHGLGEPRGAELAAVEHDGQLVLCRKSPGQ
jgi:hypothetical protein